MSGCLCRCHGPEHLILHIYAPCSCPTKCEHCSKLEEYWYITTNGWSEEDVEMA